MSKNDNIAVKGQYDTFYLKEDFANFPRSERALVLKLVSKYQLKGGSVLDVGCGTGRYTELFRKAGLDAFGIDLSKTAISKAIDSFPECNFMISDINEAEFKNQNFDIIFCHGFSPFLQKDMKKQDDILKKMVSFLKKDGIFFFGATSRLTDRLTKTGSRLDYSLKSYLELFNKVPELKIQKKLTIYPHFFLFPKWFVFSPTISIVSSQMCKLTGVPLRVYIVSNRL